MNINIKKIFSEEVNAITHPSRHHTDEVFATVMLSVLFPVVLFRTRDQKIIESAADVIVYDVGGVFDSQKKRFDHHQKDFAEARPDGTLYASAGLIWRQYGTEIVRKLSRPEIDDEIIARVVARVDENLIKNIDARDNGQLEKTDSMSISSVINLFNSLWDEDEDEDEGFLEACRIADTVLRREIKFVTSTEYGCKLVSDQISDAEGSILVMDRFIGGWQKAVIESDNPKAKELLYGIFPAENGDWNIKALTDKGFPEPWRSLKDAQLAEISGVESAVFCHRAGHFAVTKTKEDAIKLAAAASA